MIKYTSSEGGIIKPFPPKIKGAGQVIELLSQLRDNIKDSPNGEFYVSQYITGKSRYTIHAIFFYKRGKLRLTWDCHNGIRKII